MSLHAEPPCSWVELLLVIGAIRAASLRPACPPDGEPPSGLVSGWLVIPVVPCGRHMDQVAETSFREMYRKVIDLVVFVVFLRLEGIRANEFRVVVDNGARRRRGALAVRNDVNPENEDGRADSARA